MDQNKKLLNQLENISFQLTPTAEPRSALQMSKIFLKNFQKVDIQALGCAIDTAVKCAEYLQRTGLATIQKIQTLTEILEEIKEPKIIISLKVTEGGLFTLNKEIMI